jgi:MFS family permease
MSVSPRPRFQSFPLGALRHRVFALYAGGHFVSQLGTWIQQVATGWLVWILTGSEAWLGLVAFCQFAPGMLLAPIAGAWADRLDRLTIVRVCQTGSAILAALLWFLVATDAITPPLLLAIVLGAGAVGSMSLPSMRAVVSGLVPRDAIGSAVSINAITLNVARFVGPAVAGILIHLDQLALCFLLNALSYAAFLIAVELVRRSAPFDEAPIRSARYSTYGAILEGAGYVWRHPLMPTVLALYFVYALLARPVIDLLPAIVVQLLGRGAETLALLNSTFGVVAIFTGFALAAVTRLERHRQLLLIAMAALGMGTLLLVYAPGLEVAVLAMLVFGAAQVTLNVCSQTVLQLAAPDPLRGRVLALHFMMFRAGAAIGGLAIGALAERAGLALVFAVASALMVVAAAAAWWGRPGQAVDP